MQRLLRTLERSVDVILGSEEGKHGEAFRRMGVVYGLESSRLNSEQ